MEQTKFTFILVGGSCKLPRILYKTNLFPSKGLCKPVPESHIIVNKAEIHSDMGNIFY